MELVKADPTILSYRTVPQLCHFELQYSASAVEKSEINDSEFWKSPKENKILSFSYNSLPIGPEYLKPFLPIFG